MREWALGVDLGTSFCAAAIATGDRVEILEVGRERRIPSTVVLDDTGTLIAGGLAQRMIGRAPERAERNPKRYVGRPPMLLGGTPVEARDALGALLELFLVEGRSRFDGEDPHTVVLTHPVAWTEPRRAVLRAAAGKVAPASRLILIEEPVAAAVHYSTSHSLGRDGRVAVYDLGGGTFDTAVLSVGPGGDFTVVGRPGGDDQIGGEAFDERVYAHFGQQLAAQVPDWWQQVSTSAERRWLAAAGELLAEARTAKETLSAYPTASQYISNADTDVDINRAELEELIGADIARTADILDETIRHSGGGTGSGLGDSLVGIFLTGGASRIPLVQQVLRERHGSLVRTWDDPKIVVALGAARIAAGHAGDEPTIAPVRQTAPQAPSAEPADEFPARLNNVVMAMATATDVYALTEDDGVTSLHHLDRDTAMPDRSLRMAHFLSWAASTEGVLVATSGAVGAQVHTLSPELVIRSTRSLASAGAPVLLAHGDRGWAFLHQQLPAPVSNTIGLPWGDLATLHVADINLTGTFVQDTPPRSLGANARWHLNEDNAARRLIDQDSPSGSVPVLSQGEPSCVVILGKFTSRAPLGASPTRPGGLTGGKHTNVVATQAVYTIGPAGEVTRSAERTANWLHQAIFDGQNWYLATTAGLEIGTAPDVSTLVAARPRAGALRWYRAGSSLYAIGMQQVLPARGLWIAVWEQGGLRTLLQDPKATVLGHLTSTVADERAAVVVDGDDLWLTASGGDGRTRLVRVTPAGTTEVRSLTGWLEPVARLATGLVCLYDPGSAPGIRRSRAARLILLPLS